MSQILDPVKLLTDLSNSKANGKLLVTDGKAIWSIYLENGQIKCAANSVQYLMLTLDHHLRCLGLQNAAAAAKSIPTSSTEGEASTINWLEGGRIIPSINWLIQQNHLQRDEAEAICTSMSLEAVETFLWLRKGRHKWSKNSSLPQHTLAARLTFKNAEVSSSIAKIQQKIEQWKNFSPAIASPYYCPYLEDSQKLNSTSAPILLKLEKFLKGLSFRQLALILNQDELKIAQLLYPSIKKREIAMRSPKSPFDLLPFIPAGNGVIDKQTIQNDEKFKVACIDDSPTILDEMQRFLSNDIYEITRIEDPLKAAPILLRLKPDLILMDISMPNINGYKLCSFFRASASLKKVPIIMVSGRTGFIDKTRAKMVGATDYLTKPFSRNELLSVVDKYLSKTKVST
ncbi:MAG: response regulator [Cyanobacteria bacterium P01_G01_bin.19]